MKKMGKRFVALVVVFASIVSFLPIQFGLNGQAANAVDSSATDIEVKSDSGTNVVDSTNKPIYSTESQSAFFSISVKNLIKNEALINVNQTDITDQKVIITEINRIKLDDQATYDANIATLKNLGVTFDDDTPQFGENYQSPITGSAGDTRRGTLINGLPLGVNEIKYRVDVTETTIKQTDPNNSATRYGVDNLQKGEVKTINIEHANKFVQSQIGYVEFVDYVGGRSTDTNPENNIKPFQFTQKIDSTSGKTLRFEHDLPNSVSDMDYNIEIPNGIVTTATDENHRDIVFVNGEKQTNISTSADSKILTGSLVKTSDSTIILISIRHIDKSGGAINYNYSIEIKYNNRNADDDYFLKDAGITKLNYNDDSSKKAYVKKQFTTSIEDGTFIYTGSIFIDKMAGMISMEPIMGRNATAKSNNTAFIITNHYDGKILDAKNYGKQYIDFQAGTNNEIWVEVYEGKDGNVTGDKPLAIYKLKVNLIGDSESIVNFKFPNSILTQPGRSMSDGGIDFNPDRRTYDLYFNDDSNSVSVTVDSPKTFEDEAKTKRREYIKAWGGTSVLGDNVTELTDIDKSATINIDMTKYQYKKVILQAYYDQTVYDDVTHSSTTTSYPVGLKYTFYIAKFADIPDGGITTSSSDASLSNITVKNANIKSTDGTNGFSSSKNNYTVSVPKADTSAAITAIATNSKVKDITATITETGDEYGLTSGELFNFTLNSSGTTSIKIVVTAQDGITSKTYNITITNDTRSASALLRNVVTDNGDFTFDADADPNKIRVDQTINKLKVSPVPEDSKSKITVNGEKYSGTPITIDLAGSQETDMEIVVTSEDGSDSKTYNFEIYRTDSPIDDNNNTNTDVFYDDIDDCWVDTSKYEEWGTIKGKSVYFNNKGRQVKNQWINTKNIWYYLDSNGYKTTGWRKDIGGKSYYLDPTTGQLKTGWISINSKWYYLGKNGVMQKGWLSLNGKWYYFTPEGEMVVNQSMFVDDKVYNFGQDGAIY